MTARDAAFGGCLAVGGLLGSVVAFYAFFLATEDPASWLARHVRPH